MSSTGKWNENGLRTGLKVPLVYQVGLVKGRHYAGLQMKPRDALSDGTVRRALEHSKHNRTGLGARFVETAGVEWRLHDC